MRVASVRLTPMEYDDTMRRAASMGAHRLLLYDGASRLASALDRDWLRIAARRRARAA